MSQRYFLTAESTYESLRQSLNTALAYPNALGKSVFQTALYAPRDTFRRVLLAVDTDLPGYDTVSASVAPLLDSDAMEEIDEATYLAALATATAGAATWDDITGKPSTFTPSAHAATHAAGGADEFRQRYIGEWAAGTYSRDEMVFKLTNDGVAIYVCEYATGTNEPGVPNEAGDAWQRISASGVAGLATVATTNSYDDLDDLPTLHDRSHAITSTSDHTATAWRVFYSNGSGVVTELTLGNAGQALISNGAAAAPSWGQAGSNSASDLTSGTLAYARMADPTVTSPSQITGNQNNYASFARGINRFTTNGAYNLTGMEAGNDGEVRVITNVGTTAANTLTIKDQNTSSSAANRFAVPWAGDLIITNNASVVVFYDGTTQRWRVV